MANLREEHWMNWWSGRSGVNYYDENGNEVTGEATKEELREPQQLQEDLSHRELYKGKELEKMTDEEFEEYCLWLACEVARCDREERKRGLQE